MNPTPQDMDEALRLIDKLNMINGAVLIAITENGALTKDEYNQLYVRTLAEWERKHAVPNN